MSSPHSPYQFAALKNGSRISWIVDSAIAPEAVETGTVSGKSDRTGPLLSDGHPELIYNVHTDDGRNVSIGTGWILSAQPPVKTTDRSLGSESGTAAAHARDGRAPTEMSLSYRLIDMSR